MITPPYSTTHVSHVRKSIKFAVATKFLSVVLIIGILLSFSYVLITANFEKQAQASNLTSDNILGLINSERKKANLKALSLDPKLMLAAENKAEDMGVKLYFDHYSPTGKRGISFITDTGLKYQIAAENLAVLFSDSQELVASWMDSPTHKKNILKPEFELTGIGLFAGTFEGYKTTFVVQFFADNVQPAAAITEIGTLKSTPPVALKQEPVEIQAAPPELTQEQKDAIKKEQEQKQFQDNFEKTKQDNISDIKSVLDGLAND